MNLPKPKVSNGERQREVDRLETQFDEQSKQMSEQTIDQATKAPAKEAEVQTQLSKKEIAAFDAPVIKPSQTLPGIGKRKPEQDAMRKRAWEYVKVIAENIEISGEKIELWHKAPFGGEPCTYWQIPVNLPIYIPRFLAEHLAKRSYQRLVMQNSQMSEASNDIRGFMVAAETRHRLNCRLVGF